MITLDKLESLPFRSGLHLSFTVIKHKDKMRYIILLMLITSSCLGKPNKLIELAEKHVETTIPEDLKVLWSTEFEKIDNWNFHFYNYGEMVLLGSNSLSNESYKRDVQGSMIESNRLYSLKSKGEIDEQEYRKLKSKYFLDPIMLSKQVEQHLNTGKNEADKILVFATSTWQEAFTYLFYRFDSNKSNKGIWIWKMENSKYPVKIADSASELFIDDKFLIKGFPTNKNVRKILNHYCENSPIPDSLWTSNIIPQKDMRQLIDEIADEIIYFNDQYISMSSTDKIKEINNFLKRNNIKQALKNEDVNLRTRLKEIIDANFNPNNETNIMMIQFYETNTFGLSSVKSEQAAELNVYGMLQFGNKKETDLAFEFING